jgi:hypothetical protein
MQLLILVNKRYDSSIKLFRYFGLILTALYNHFAHPVEAYSR